MRTTVSTTLLVLAAGWLTACQPTTDSVGPTIAPATPAVSYRVVKTQTNHPIATTVEYSYASNGQLGTSRSAPDADGIWKQLAPTVQYSYDKDQRPAGTEAMIVYRDAAGRETSRVQSHYGTFSTESSGLTASYTLFVNSANQPGRLFEEHRYGYDAARRVSQETYTHYDENPAIGPLETRYQLSYTGDDVTGIVTTVSAKNGLASTTRTVFEYDDKANPYYGLAAPELLPQLRYSRHNVTRQTISSGTSPANELTYQLTYAPNGTLTRWTCSDGRYQTFTYETY